MERSVRSPEARDIPLPLSPTPPRPNTPPNPILGKRRVVSNLDRVFSPSNHSPRKSRVWHGFTSSVRKGYEAFHSSDSEEEDARMSEVDPGDLSALVVPIKRGARPPYRATPGSAGYDLNLPADITLNPHMVTTVPLGS